MRSGCSSGGPGRVAIFPTRDPVERELRKLGIRYPVATELPPPETAEQQLADELRALELHYAGNAPTNTDGEGKSWTGDQS